MEENTKVVSGQKERIGEICIADEVVAVIAALAALEVEGVDSMAGNITNDLVGKLGMKNLSRVIAAIENMTGLKVLEVNVKIAGVNID